MHLRVDDLKIESEGRKDGTGEESGGEPRDERLPCFLFGSGSGCEGGVDGVIYHYRHIVHCDKQTREGVGMR